MVLFKRQAHQSNPAVIKPFATIAKRLSCEVNVIEQISIGNKPEQQRNTWLNVWNASAPAKKTMASLFVHMHDLL